MLTQHLFYQRVTSRRLFDAFVYLVSGVKCHPHYLEGFECIRAGQTERIALTVCIIKPLLDCHDLS